MTEPTSRICVHLTKILPGQLSAVQERLDSYVADTSALQDMGISRLMFFTTSELADDVGDLVVAVLEGRDDESIRRFLDENEAASADIIKQLYFEHTHELVTRAHVRSDARV